MQNNGYGRNGSTYRRRRSSAPRDDRKYSNRQEYYDDYDDRYYDDYRNDRRNTPQQRQDYDNDESDSLTTKFLGFMTRDRKAKKKTTQKTVICNNVQYDSAAKCGDYQDIRTGEVQHFD